MAPKQQATPHWTDFQHGRRLEYQRKREAANQPMSLPPSDPAHTGSREEAEDEALRVKYGETKGMRPPMYPNHESEEMEVAVHEYTLPAAFGPARHVFMVMGRPCVV